MVNFKRLFLIIISLSSIDNLAILNANIPVALSLNCNTGRLGDQITLYCKAKLLAEEKHFDFYLPENNKYSGLKLYETEKLLTPEEKSKFTKIIDLNKFEDLLEEHTEPTLYLMDFFFDSPRWWAIDLLSRCRANEKIHNELRELIKPIGDIKYLNLPEDSYKIAVHIRTSSDREWPQFSVQLYDLNKPETLKSNYYEKLYKKKPKLLNFKYDEKTLEIKRKSFIDKKDPDKFPPLQYYINQLNNFLPTLEHKKIYIFIFTDHRSPNKLKNIIAKHVLDPRVTFDAREKHVTVLEDLFNIVKFDCLVRGYSNYSFIADLIGNFETTIMPTGFKWIEDALHFEGIAVKNQELKL